jgi:thiol-disulfide isomerase/thioredoxin
VSLSGLTLRPHTRMPALDGATGWLNTEPLTTDRLHGRVVLVDFWTYTCINWRRTLPHLRAWAAKYESSGLVVLGVHTPEFSFERGLPLVQGQVAAMGIEYPVVLDSDYAIWEAFANHYWPALYFVDATGRIRSHHFGEGNFEESEMVLRRLIGETGAELPAEPLVSVSAEGAELGADWDALMSGENYLGSARTADFASPEGLVPDLLRDYTVPSRLPLNSWALAGSWTVGPESAVLAAGGGVLADRFWARDLHLVAGPDPDGDPVRFTLRLDGEPPGPEAGVDVAEDGTGVLAEPRMHHLVRQRGPVVQRTVEITFADPGARAYVLTFG